MGAKRLLAKLGQIMPREREGAFAPTRHSGAARRAEPGIHRTAELVEKWIPGLCQEAHPGMTKPDLIAPQLCGQYRAQNGRKSAGLAAFLRIPALYFSTRSGFTAFLPLVP
jgi:hypothetical protein